MIRNLKILGLGLTAALAISAVGASTASAIELTAGGYPAHLHGTSVNVGSKTTAPNMMEFRCPTSTGQISKASSSFSLSPGGCATADGTKLGHTMNGCEYVFGVTTKVASDHASGTMAITCPVGKLIEVHQYVSESAETSGTSNCTFTISSGSGLGTVTYTSDTAKGHVLVQGTVGNFTNQTHGACTFGFTINGNLTFHHEFTLEAKGATLHVG